MARMVKVQDMSSLASWERVVDVLMGVDEAALHHIVVSLLCILLVIEEEEASCPLVGVDKVDVQIPEP